MSNPSASDILNMNIRALPDSKVWIFPDQPEVPKDLIDVALGSPVIAALLMRRGMKTAEHARQFLDESSYVPTPPSELPDVDKAVARIRKAIDEKQHITIYGDYDVDGVTGTSVLLTVLKELGADVDYYIPNRVSEGYGLNLKAISILASKKKTRLIITCDCGVSNFAEIGFARSLSVDTLVLDHHTMPEVLPPAVAVVHPKLLNEEHPLYHLPGVGVAYKVCEALLNEMGKPEKADELLDYVTMGMIADLVPLIRENRYLVKIGLEKLVKTNRIGLKALLAQVNGQSDTDLVGFGMAPRINAAGRLSDASKAVELLTTDDTTVAENIAHELHTENLRRQEMCEQIFMQADLRVQKQLQGNGWHDQKCIAIYDRDWHHGVVGIVASRLVEKYHRPVFIGQHDVEENVVRGSARGVEQIDLYQVLKANEHLLNRWGGHKMAAGFSVEFGKAEELCRALISTCNRMMSEQPLAGIVEVDLHVEQTSVDLDLAKQLRVLAPFGMSNRKPRFCMKGLMTHEVRTLGKEGKHHKLMLKGEKGELFECVMWNSQGRVPNEGRPVDLVFTADVNTFNGRERLQLVVNDWRDLHVGDEVTSYEQVKDALNAALAKQNAASLSDTAGGAAVAAPVASTPVVDAGSVSPAAVLDSMAKAVENIAKPMRDSLTTHVSSVKFSWSDLRANEQALDLLKRGKAKFGPQMMVFGETCAAMPGVLVDRTGVTKAPHLMIWQFPPTQEVFQQLLQSSGCEKLYFIGAGSTETDEPAAYLKRLYGLVRYAVNQKEGKVEADKLAALMGGTKMTLALALGVLKGVHLIDWFTEEGVIHLDYLGHTEGAFEETPEYQQLAQNLDEIKAFRRWCAETPLKEIQLSLIRNSVPMTRETDEEPLGSEEGIDDDYDNSDGQTTENGIGTSS
ncbi:single-stranded-DNA-specific exonuclease RecJ [Candidatus Obscuribacterales bacterium]|nr:single-stranded-DNA-specific exonuclease RecJ [Candidatus Obscuribacterales bacterium]MBX3150697.1 single-stranded-DNA-specific exonuclease RecJ [Candidatus Obscuribacterales bacterium]